jgi:hypothetical protein
MVNKDINKKECKHIFLAHENKCVDCGYRYPGKCRECFEPAELNLASQIIEEGWEDAEKPDEIGIYPTSKCYRKLYEFVCEQKVKAVAEYQDKLLSGLLDLEFCYGIPEEGKNQRNVEKGRGYWDYKEVENLIISPNKE